VFGIGLPELLVIIVVAVLVFGPDRLPEFGRQAGRMVRQVRRFALGAQSELRKELGPEYADLKLTDLDPRQMIRKHLLDALDDEDDAVAGGPYDAMSGAGLLAAGERPPFDPEAT
jgi:sec-independent protein translocase protein TatB